MLTVMVKLVWSIAIKISRTLPKVQLSRTGNGALMSDFVPKDLCMLMTCGCNYRPAVYSEPPATASSNI